MKRIFSLLAFTLCASAPLLAQPALAQPAEKPAKKPAAAKKTVTPAGTAHVRFLHALPSIGAVDIYARETEKIKTGLAYKGLTDYTEVKSGKMALKITATGKTDGLLKDAATLTKDKWYTIAVYGDTAAPLLLLVNESTGKEMPDKARVRVVNLVAGAPAVAVTKPSKRAEDGSANFLSKPLDYGKTASKTLAPATQTIQLRDADGKMLKEMLDLKLDAGQRYSAFALGKVGGTGDMAIDVVMKTAAK